MSSYYDSFGGTDGPNDDPDGTAADAREAADDEAEHPERYAWVGYNLTCTRCKAEYKPDHQCITDDELADRAVAIVDEIIAGYRSDSGVVMGIRWAQVPVLRMLMIQAATEAMRPDAVQPVHQHTFGIDGALRCADCHALINPKQDHECAAERQ